MLPGCRFLLTAGARVVSQREWPRRPFFRIAGFSWLERLFLACSLPVPPLFLYLLSYLLPHLLGRPCSFSSRSS
jgi:hypothetical protein